MGTKWSDQLATSHTNGTIGRGPFGPIRATNSLLFIGIKPSAGNSADPIGRTNLLVFIGMAPLDGGPFEPKWNYLFAVFHRKVADGWGDLVTI